MKAGAHVLLILFYLVAECIQQKDSFNCGVRPMEETIERYVDEKSEPGQWPWYGVVYHRQAGRTVEYACGCTLISQKHVITARVCVAEDSGSLMNSSRILVQLGTNNLNVLNMGFAQYRKVKTIHQPQEEDFEGEKKKVILELSTEVKFNGYVQPICIFDKSYIVFFLARLISLGWEFNEGVGQLKTFDITDVYHIDHRPIPPSSLNDPFIYSKDPAKISIYFYEKLWNMIIAEKNEIHWIAKITNLEYLLQKRKGHIKKTSKPFKELLPRRYCGKGILKKETSIESVRLYEFPWMAVLLSRSFGYQSEPYCVATLINYRYVITVSYCVAVFDPVVVRLGEYNLNKNPDCNFAESNECAPPVKDYEIENIINNQNGSSYYLPDPMQAITLIRTKKNIAFEDHIQPVCLPLIPKFKKLKPSQYTIIGWSGATYRLLGSLKKKTLYVANATECQISGKILKNVSFICLIERYRPGQSLMGAPVGFYHPFNGRFMLVAVMSKYYKHTGHYETFNIIPLLKWIKDNMYE